MKRINAASVALLTVSFAAVSGAWMYGQSTRNAPSITIDHFALEKLAANRFENGRGLSPCEADEFSRLEAARSELARKGIIDRDVIALVTPTFSGAELLSVSNGHLTVFRYAGETGFMPPDQWFSRPDGPSTTIALTPLEYEKVLSPLSRNVRYAMTARTSGLDGNSYYFASGRESCAYAWSPHGNGPASLIATIVNEASQGAASRRKIVALAGAIARADGGR
ncbi:hypothetical protein [Cognatilysobacter lacus]|uniref:Uncharacterized protein n=1 Tax=Cognatilysobacter lacus TaxID=1643323 RepID=A0A5D8Z7F2_9GAMM|nr:hypothetical protein [Lysobacter lacus]TZF90719.1 hypothetical protein FW784_04250 [Lysobacter lacus]